MEAGANADAPANRTERIAVVFMVVEKVLLVELQQLYNRLGNAACCSILDQSSLFSQRNTRSRSWQFNQASFDYYD
jgi:hypothetical protein